MKCRIKPENLNISVQEHSSVISSDTARRIKNMIVEHSKDPENQRRFEEWLKNQKTGKEDKNEQ